MENENKSLCGYVTCKVKIYKIKVYFQKISLKSAYWYNGLFNIVYAIKNNHPCKGCK